MAKPTAKKVFTPGSKPVRNGISPGWGRPKKNFKGRPASYRAKYNKEVLLKAVKEVQENRMSLGLAAMEFQV
jgi:hypothetical protein